MGEVETGVVEGEGYAVAHLGDLGDGPGFRKIRNLSDSDDAVYVIVGGKGGYVGRDGQLPDGERGGTMPGRSDNQG
jgi:hypothetical protein